jgi:kojibiose phosphorylase
MSVDLDGPVRFIQWIAVATGPDGPGATAAVDDIAGIVERTGPAALIERHRASWTDRWASVPRLQGDPAAADGLRFGHFHLAQAPDRASSSQMIAPRGLTDQRHGGLGFFNTDLFLTPYYALREPAVARSLLANRLSGMGAARRYAARRGWPGLWFPLVVDPRGEPVAARHPGREAIAQSSLHMTATVLYGLSRYRAATGDWPVEPQLVDRLMTEARSFQQAILDRDAPATGFDEFHPAVRGHAATLGLARWALDWISAPDSMGGPVDCLGLEPGDDGAIEAFRGYRDLPERLCTNDGPGGLPRLTGAERAAAADGRALDSRLVKQADVVLMLALFPDRFPTEVAAACLDYYGCRTAHASSLSPAAHGLVAMRCGRSEQGWRYIAKALRWNLDFEPRETYRNGVHLAASAGGWLSIIDGILGLRVSTARRQATLRPRLPPQVRSLSGTTTLLGRHIDWRVEDGRIDVAGPGIACHRHGDGAAAVTVTIP